MSFFLKGLQALQEKVRALNEARQNPLPELFTNEFLHSYTTFTSLKDMTDRARAAGFRVESQDDWDSIPTEPWNAFIAAHTQFSTWQHMLETASSAWLKRQFGIESGRTSVL